MTKILRPVPVDKRLPEIPKGELASAVVLIIYSNESAPSTFSFVDHSGKWLNPEKTVTHWYEEIEIESLFPDDEKAYRVASTAGNGTIYKTALHQEGQDFVKNHILRELKK